MQRRAVSFRLLVCAATLLAVGGRPGSVRRASAWPIAVDGSEHEDGDFGTDVALDPAGNVLVAGTLENEVTGADLVALKLDATTGAELWRHEVAGYYNTLYYDNGYGIRSDPAGNVFVVGQTTALGSLINMTAMRLDPGTGAEVWRRDISGAAGALSYDVGRTMTLAHDGDVIVGGAIQDDPGLINADFAVVRLAGTDGAIRWRSLTPGNSTAADPGRGDYVQAVAVDAADDVVAAGWVVDDGLLPGHQYIDMFVLKLSGTDGTERWRYVRRGSATLGSNIAHAVAVDGAGDVLVAGQANNISSGPDFVVAKLDGSTGTQLWRNDGVFPGDTTSIIDQAAALAVEANGDVIAVGTSGNDLAVLKFRGSDGAVLWQRLVPNSVDSANSANSVAIDGNGDAIVAGSVDDHFGLLKIAGSDGAVLWQRTLRQRVAGASAVAVALDAAGNAAATGQLNLSEASGWDLAAVKVAGASGVPLGCGNGTLDRGEECDDGNTVGLDGCDSGCSIECGNGTLDPLEACDDGNRVDGDGCEADCRLTVCAGGASVTGLKVVLRRLGGGPGTQSGSVKGDLGFPAGMPPGYDPMTQGAQLLVEDLGSGREVFDLSRRTTPIPGTAAGACGAHDGWRASGTRAAYANHSGAIDPPTCTAGSAAGLKRLTLTDRRASRQTIHFDAGIAHTTLAAPVGPLRVTVVLGASASSGMSGACGRQAFAAAQCVHDVTGTKLICK